MAAHNLSVHRARPSGGALQATARYGRLSKGESGIAPEHYAQIFEPLYTTQPGGTGLGLYIVQEVMAAHARQVAVQSTVGADTVFTLTLPVIPAQPLRGS
ncbi:MAG: ATP-binding protein [Candidatus Tectimicrobiota bacterium]